MIQHPKDFIRERQIGEYKITLPAPPQAKDIANYNLPKEKQKFYVTQVPSNFRALPPGDRKKFIDAEWNKRLNGYWFYNNGNIEYITGLHYFYINFWKINADLPQWVDSDRDFFYLWKSVEYNALCDGLNYYGPRGDGKTAKGSVILYEPISRRYNVKAGIQSKTEGDAKKIFKRVVHSWSKLPYFFRPIDSGVSRPTTILEFVAPSKRDTKNQDKEDADVLNSFIDFNSSAEEAYDGDTLHRVLQDETGKTKDINVDERMKVVRETLRAGVGRYGRGKIFATTTVEEMEKKGGAKAKKIWDEADISKLDANGQTKNGMWRYFKPADYGFLEIINGERFVDEYGYSLREKAKQYFMNRRATLTGADLNSYKRKYPLEEKDMWVSDTKKSVYDIQKIDDQIAFNESIGLGGPTRGNFYWIDGIRFGNVGWNPCENGRWLLSWLPQPELRNKSVIKNGKRAPGNTDLSVAGLDPYDNNTTVDDRKSDAASYVFRKFDPLLPYDTGIFVSEYLNRPATADLMFEDILMQSIFYGHEILIESNKIGCINFFKRHGYENYLMRRPEETQTTNSRKMVDDYGIPMSGAEARQALVYAVESHIIAKVGWIKEENKEPYMGKCPFNRLLLQLKDFDFDSDWTAFDTMVGAGLALLGARKYIVKKKEVKALNLFPQFRMNGTSSELI